MISPRKSLLLLALLSACRSDREAVQQALAGATCAVDDYNRSAICIQGTVLIVCSATGRVKSEAYCRVIGDVTFRGPVLERPRSTP